MGGLTNAAVRVMYADDNAAAVYNGFKALFVRR